MWYLEGNVISCMGGSRNGAVERALAFHQCGPGSIPELGVRCGLSLLLKFSFLLREVFLRVLRFSSILKKLTFLNFNSIWTQWTKSHPVDC